MKPDLARSLWPQLGILFAVFAVHATCVPAQAGRVPVVRDTVYRSASEFGPDTLLIREFEFEGPILSAAVDAPSGVVIVAFLEKYRDARSSRSSRSITAEDVERNRLLAYDPQARRVAWDKEGEFIPLLAHANRALLGHGTRVEMVRAADGGKLGSIDGTPFVWGDGVALRVTDDGIFRWDLDSGFDLWKADREIRGSVDLLIRRDSVAYLVADGIQKVDLRKGLRWSYSIRASRKGLYSTPYGGTEQVRSLYGGSSATNLTAAPLIHGPDVYFAADTTVVRLDSGTGAVRWSQHLTRQRGFSLKQRALGLPSTEEFLGRLVLRDAGSNIAVASLGWASGPKYSLKADPPTIALLAKRDGHILARAQVSGITFLNDTYCTSTGCFLLAADRVLLMDDSLRVRATFQARNEIQPLGRFVDLGGAIVLTTNSGIIALSPDSLKLVWSRRCGRMLAIESQANEFGARYAVSTQGLILLDRSVELRPRAYYPLRGNWAELRDGLLLQGAGTRLRVVALVERGPAQRLD